MMASIMASSSSSSAGIHARRHERIAFFRENHRAATHFTQNKRG
jgi:hypothetical protein